MKTKFISILIILQSVFGFAQTVSIKGVISKASATDTLTFKGFAEQTIKIKRYY
jgi:hypothetical protein